MVAWLSGEQRSQEFQASVFRSRHVTEAHGTSYLEQFPCGIKSRSLPSPAPTSLLSFAKNIQVSKNTSGQETAGFLRPVCSFLLLQEEAGSKASPLQTVSSTGCLMADTGESLACPGATEPSWQSTPASHPLSCISVPLPSKVTAFWRRGSECMVHSPEELFLLNPKAGRAFPSPLITQSD